MDENKKTADKAPLYFVGDFGEKERNGGTFRSFFPSETLAAPLCKTPTKPDNKGAKPHECVAHSDVMTNQVKCSGQHSLMMFLLRDLCFGKIV